MFELNRVFEGCLNTLFRPCLPNTLFAGCLGWGGNRETEQGPNRVFGQTGCSNRVFGQTGCSNRVFAEHPRNTVFEYCEHGVCGVFEYCEQCVCGVFGTPRNQGVCICSKIPQVL